ncbi:MULTISPECIES: AMP-binding protein [Hydrocarboniphaga]|uniref:AMP-binding domain protein n=1 Tax=Hydrocarboniphaga effusa AP103 TaxID=1172194 RepID=I8T7L4_9GAMM|nr:MULTISPECIES: AMP-binding protein [Hydrocarboniphaga]EIT69743.1 AMP-binding domain protein [Hydrocarboniphaga effusa AP103]MDZ4078875.1 AMP-binding protein [Hydrocarboniphaga sp.]
MSANQQARHLDAAADRTMSGSQVRGVATLPLLEYTIGEALQRAVQRWPEREALVSVHQGIRLSYAQFGARVDEIAAALLALGLSPGDRVGVWACNCVEWTLAQFATAKAGLIQVNINPAYRLSEVEYTLNKVGVKVLIAAESYRSSDYVGMIEALAPEIADSTAGMLDAARLPTLKTVIKIGGAPRAGWLRFDDLPQLARPVQVAKLLALQPSLHARQAINIQFTSGTTGSPKGATLSHRNILNNGYFVGASMDLREGDRLCIPVPLYHCFGMVMGNLACITRGATMIYPAPTFDALATLKAIESERCTGLHGVPTMFIAQVEHPEFKSFDLSSLRNGVMAGAPCPEEVMRKLIAHMNLRDITIAYGMTETSPVSFQSSPSSPLDRRVSTVGRVQPHLECKVIDSDGKVVAHGERGELCTRGYSVMLGYWNDAEKTAEAIDADGYMHTGDLATIDAEGYCAIVGRIKDLVIRGGENIYPREIEEFLFKHPLIEDAQVVGVPDEKYGEEVCVWVKLRAGATMSEAQLREFCRERIAHYKVPRYVRFVEEFPMTVTGKIQKFMIRDAMTREIASTSQPMYRSQG